MNQLARTLALLGVLVGSTALGQQQDSYDYFQANRQMIRNGMQALLMCNGLFTGGRTLDDVIEQELAYMQDPRMIGAGGMVGADEYLIDNDRQAVAVGGPTSGTVVRAAFREGIGCVVMAPDQDFDDIDSLPKLELPYPDFDPATTPWPNGDLVANKPLPPNVDARTLQAASDFAFEKHAEGHVTLSLLVVYKGDIIHERYADGVDMTTRTRTWSTAKSIAATLIGMLVDQGKLALDEPLGFEWEPKVENPQNDPRNKITLRHVLNMSSGLYPVDSSGREYAIGSGLSYWAGASSIHGMRDRGLIREPGTFWDYENYDTLLAVYAMKQALGNDQAYQEFPRKALLDKIGMRNTLVSADRFHDFILSSQVYTNARDLARFGLLYLQNGVWDGERLLSEQWIDFSRTPAPATRHRGSMYGGQWWLVPDDRHDVPKSAYSTAGNRGQFVIVVPTHDTVIVRRGLDYGRRAVTNWDYAREVLKAIGPDAEISR
ncbi:MAG: serine hydrolase [Woeseiaceae bacterium]|nr:serine hydrolase [Woeseiaceae bacterium]